MAENDWNGTWNTRWVNSLDKIGAATMTVTVSGDAFNGSWGSGTSLVGKLAGCFVQGKWVGADGVTDTFWFVLGPDGRTFAGFYSTKAAHGPYTGPWWGIRA